MTFASSGNAGELVRADEGDLSEKGRGNPDSAAGSGPGEGEATAAGGPAVAPDPRFEVVSEGFYIKDADLRYVQLNSAMEKLLGRRRESILGRTDEEILGRDRSSYLTRLEETVLQGRPLEARCDGIFADLDATYVIREAPLQGDDGRVKGLCGSCSHAPEKPNGPASAPEDEGYLRTAFENALDAFYLSDSAGRFLDGNQAAEKLIGYGREELLGHSFLRESLLPPEELPKAARGLLMSSLGRSTAPEDYTLVRRDGTRLTVEIRTHPAKVGGRPAILGIARDATEARRRSEELLRARGALNHASGTAGGIARDLDDLLRELLTGLGRACGLGPARGPASDCLREIVSRVRRAADLVVRLRSLARPDLPAQRPLFLGPLARDVMEFIRASLPPSTPARIEIDPACGPVQADPVRMQRALLLLGSIACEGMTGPGASLSLRLTPLILTGAEQVSGGGLPAGAYARLSVRATGSGMEPEVAERVFQPGGALSEERPGASPNLAAVRALVREDGGDLRVRSTPGEGTEFSLLLPLHPLQETAPPAETPTRSGDPGFAETGAE